MNAKITIAKATDIEHNSTEDAGFDSGYRWHLTDPTFGDIESFAPTQQAARDAALAAARARGYDEDHVDL